MAALGKTGSRVEFPSSVNGIVGWWGKRKKSLGADCFVVELSSRRVDPEQHGRAWGSGCSGGRLLQKCLAQGIVLGVYMLSLEGTLHLGQNPWLQGPQFPQVERGLDPVVKAVKLHWDEPCTVVK